MSSITENSSCVSFCANPFWRNKQTINSATKLQRKYRNFRVFVQTHFGLNFIFFKKKFLKTPEEPTKLAKEGKIETLVFLHKPILEIIPKKKNQQQNYKGNTETLEFLCKPILFFFFKNNF